MLVWLSGLVIYKPMSRWEVPFIGGPVIHQKKGVSLLQAAPKKALQMFGDLYVARAHMTPPYSTPNPKQ